MKITALLDALNSALAEPFALAWVSNSPRFLLVFTVIYAVAVIVAVTDQKNTRPGAEHGSAAWGDVFRLNKFYMDRHGSNLLLTQHFHIGIDGYKHKHNTNILIVGGSGAGKTRTYGVPNVLECACSMVITDPKAEILRKTGNLLKQKGYEVIVFDLINPAASFCYNPFVYVHDDREVLTLIENLIRNTTPSHILKKREYLGHTINFKTRKHFKDKKSHYVDESEWTIFENTHEAIIDQETFDNVQRIRANVRRYPDGWGEAHPLTGLMYCADCGGKMYVHRTYNGKRDPQFTCSQYTKVPCGTLCGTQHRIRAEAVLTLITDMLRAIAEYSKNDRAEFIRTVQETQAAQQTADISKKRKRLAAAQKRAGELEKLICKIYEDNALGKLPDARYEALDAQYAKEQDALNTEIAELEKAVTGYEQSRKSAEKFIALIDKYENFDTLTNTMLNEFVEKILVHERARKGSQDTTQEVEIYFNFVGRYIPPALQPLPLTPEEQEALRKKEERKDRLHQNYLRRKANGKQKEWEERYNARRKAQVEAAKAAIRAEDMEKGVFIPVSQLPKQEPRKAALPASAAV